MNRNDLYFLFESYKQIKENEKLLNEGIYNDPNLTERLKKEKEAAAARSKGFSSLKGEVPTVSKNPLTHKELDAESARRAKEQTDWLEEFDSNIKYYFEDRKNKLNDLYNYLVDAVNKNKEKLKSMKGIHDTSKQSIEMQFDTFLKAIKEIHDKSEEQFEDELKNKQLDHIDELYKSIIDQLGKVVNMPKGFGVWAKHRRGQYATAQGLRTSTAAQPTSVKVGDIFKSKGLMK